MHNSALLRKEILAKRDQMKESDRQLKSKAIQKTLFRQKELQKCNCIFIYVNFRSEVITREIIEHLLDQGKQVAVPVTRVKEKRLDIISISDPDQDLAPGYCDIPEPTKKIQKTGAISPKMIDIIILPGSVFDRRGGRFGYGGGYYDRLLSQIPGARRIALAFDLQVVDRVPLQDHDEILDCIITESTIYTNSERSG